MKAPSRQTTAPKDPDGDVVSATEAAALLDVKVATLYAYVSRGLLRSRQSPGSKQKRYARADVLRLKERADARRGHDAAAKDALNWGAPIVESAITRIDDDGPHYRGRSLVSWWSEAATDGRDAFAHCARVLARGDDHTAEHADDAIDDELARAADIVADAIVGMSEAAPPATPLMAVDLVCTGWRLCGPVGVFDEAREWQKARLVLGHIAASQALRRGPEIFRRAVADHRAIITRPVGVLRRSLSLGPTEDGVLARVLVVLADHELNASTFSARVTASTGATLAACMSAALATVSGPRHGAASAAFEALIDEVQEPRRAHMALSARLSRGDGVPGFGHRLYPQGDPRAPWLLDDPAVRGHADVAVVVAIIDAWQGLAGKGALTMPSIDVALVAACRAMKLPPGTATALFAIARSAGWVAHIFEQRRSLALLRPRARYVGP